MTILLIQVLHFESSIIYALLVAVTVMMYHLNVTLKLIFDKEERISIETIRTKERYAIILGVTLAIINCLTRLVANFFESNCTKIRIGPMID